MSQPQRSDEARSQIDLSGLNCPLPVLKTKAALARMDAGSLLEVIVTHPDSVKEFQSLCSTPDLELEGFSEQEGRYVYLIRKRK